MKAMTCLAAAFCAATGVSAAIPAKDGTTQNALITRGLTPVKNLGHTIDGCNPIFGLDNEVFQARDQDGKLHVVTVSHAPFQADTVCERRKPIPQLPEQGPQMQG